MATQPGVPLSRPFHRTRPFQFPLDLDYTTPELSPLESPLVSPRCSEVTTGGNDLWRRLGYDSSDEDRESVVCNGDHETSEARDDELQGMRQRFWEQVWSMGTPLDGPPLLPTYLPTSVQAAWPQRMASAVQLFSQRNVDIIHTQKEQKVPEQDTNEAAERPARGSYVQVPLTEDEKDMRQLREDFRHVQEKIRLKTHTPLNIHRIQSDYLLVDDYNHNARADRGAGQCVRGDRAAGEGDDEWQAKYKAQHAHASADARKGKLPLPAHALYALVESGYGVKKAKCTASLAHVGVRSGATGGAGAKTSSHAVNTSSPAVKHWLECKGTRQAALAHTNKTPGSGQQGMWGAGGSGSGKVGVMSRGGDAEVRAGATALAARMRARVDRLLDVGERLAHKVPPVGMGGVYGRGSFGGVLGWVGAGVDGDDDYVDVDDESCTSRGEDVVFVDQGCCVGEHTRPATAHQTGRSPPRPTPTGIGRHLQTRPNTAPTRRVGPDQMMGLRVDVSHDAGGLDRAIPAEAKPHWNASTTVSRYEYRPASSRAPYPSSPQAKNKVPPPHDPHRFSMYGTALEKQPLTHTTRPRTRRARRNLRAGYAPAQQQESDRFPSTRILHLGEGHADDLFYTYDGRWLGDGYAQNDKMHEEDEEEDELSSPELVEAILSSPDSVQRMRGVETVARAMSGRGEKELAAQLLDAAREVELARALVMEHRVK